MNEEVIEHIRKTKFGHGPETFVTVLDWCAIKNEVIRRQPMLELWLEAATFSHAFDGVLYLLWNSDQRFFMGALEGYKPYILAETENYNVFFLHFGTSDEVKPLEIPT